MFSTIFSRISFRSLLYYAGLSLIATLFIGYALFQSRFLVTGPVVNFQDQPPTVQTQRVVTLQGTVQNIAYLELNGRQIYTDKSGYFKEALVLENGYTIATIRAQDKYGRVRSYAKEFVYTPALTNR